MGAMSSFSEGEWEAAIALFTEAIKLNPNSAAMFAKRGACFTKVQKPNACVRDCTRAIELNPDNAGAYKFRGRAHRLLGNFTQVHLPLPLNTFVRTSFSRLQLTWPLLARSTSTSKRMSG